MLPAELPLWDGMLGRSGTFWYPAPRISNSASAFRIDSSCPTRPFPNEPNELVTLAERRNGNVMGRSLARIVSSTNTVAHILLINAASLAIQQCHRL